MIDEFSDQGGTKRLEPRYSNYFTIGHNAFEFVFDFGVFYVDSVHPRLHTRVVTSPAYAKLLLTTLLESVGQFENAFGSSFEPDRND